MPTTTASYVDLTLHLSPCLHTALSRCYFGAVLLMFVVPPVFWPLSYFFAEMLVFEWQRIYHHYLRQQGPLRLYSDGHLRWCDQAGKIVAVKVVSRWLVILSIAHQRNQWLIICCDSCDTASYRLLKMSLHLGLLKPAAADNNDDANEH
ncbi:protein YgfX [Photobacterium aquimaris]|uniref:protein YgfX n=1 Tax=Photobacterium aquimaris TaxID=512643 RepID=UPI0022876398|nr:protein YgfX [Photobacterium aquimaris]